MSVGRLKQSTGVDQPDYSSGLLLTQSPPPPVRSPSSLAAYTPASRRAHKSPLII